MNGEYEDELMVAMALLIPGIAASLLFAVIVYLPVRWMLIRRGWRVTLDVLAVGIACFGVWMAVSVPMAITMMKALTWI